MHLRLQQKFDELKKAHQRLEEARGAANIAEREHIQGCEETCDHIVSEDLIDEIIDSLDFIHASVYEQIEILDIYILSLKTGMEVENYNTRVLN